MCGLGLFGERRTLVQFSVRSFKAGVESQGSSFLGLKTWTLRDTNRIGSGCPCKRDKIVMLGME